MVLKVLSIFVGVVIALVIVVMIINMFTVYPTMYFLRFVAAQDKEFVKSGDYATDISLVEKKRTIYVEDEDLYNPLPETSMSLYGLKDVKTAQPLIFFIHGGGWSLGDESVLSDYMKLLASNGYLVAGVNYALAPEHPYPTSTKQLMMSLNHLNDNADKYHIDKENIFIMGNSAGAHLTSQLGALMSNDEYAYQMNIESHVEKDHLKGLILFNGVYDFEKTADQKFPFFKHFVWSYMGVKDYMNYDRIQEASPVHYVLNSYPSSLITVGNTDPLRDQTELMIERFNEQDVEYESLMWDDPSLDLNHDFMFDLNLKPSQEVYEKVCAFLKEKTK